MTLGLALALVVRPTNRSKHSMQGAVSEPIPPNLPPETGNLKLDIPRTPPASDPLSLRPSNEARHPFSGVIDGTVAGEMVKDAFLQYLRIKGKDVGLSRSLNEMQAQLSNAASAHDLEAIATQLCTELADVTTSAQEIQRGISSSARVLAWRRLATHLLGNEAVQELQIGADAERFELASLRSAIRERATLLLQVADAMVEKYPEQASLPMLQA